MGRIFLILIGLGILGAGALYIYRGGGGAAVAQYDVPELTQDYRNDTYSFSTKIPADFSPREIPNDAGGTTVVLENNKSEGIQINIVPLDEDLWVLTAERVQQDIPDLKISNVEVVEIGEQHRGIAFKSDNPEFNGASREVWFAFRGNLFQISTYERFDPLLKAIFATWQFF